MDSKTFGTLEYDKVLARLAEHTSFSVGHSNALAIRPKTHIDAARRQQAETREAIVLLEGDNTVTIGGARDVRQPAANSVRGFMLPAEEFLNIKTTLIAARTLKRVLLKSPDKHPHLVEVAELIEECPGLVTAITATIDERGDVLDSASPALTKIRQQLRVAHGRVQDRLRTLISSSMSQYLQEAIITSRGGRYVVPLRAEHKGRIKGIVHDQSSSGATLFVEPLNTVELNNAYRELQLKETREIERILSELSQHVAAFSEPIQRVVERMGELDLIFARAKYALLTDAVEPIFSEWRKEKPPHPGSRIWIRGARHPLLDPDEVIPTDFLLDDDIFSVLITGPNTGGKTVSLKNIGLMILMAQSGLHLPANEAQLTVFEQVFADIGDEQSIEQSLSTFSGHITNIVRILKKVDARSLVVLDELGSGTDPTEGAGIAQAIINFLRDKGATSFTATHYPELKIYASQTAGATNASMLFDLDTLSPTYEMAIGIPGKSNALAIAQRLGLDQSILDDAMTLIGEGSQEAESLIDSIYDLREKISAEQAASRLAKRKAEQERDHILIEAAGIEYERKRILEEARTQAEAELESVRNEIRRARKKLRDAQSLSTVKKASKSLSEFEENQLKPIPSESDIGQKTKALRRRNKRLRVGDTVFIKGLNTKGIITTIQGKEAEIAVGRLHMRSQLDNLEFRDRQEPEDLGGTIKAPRTTSVSMELDIRGRRVEEALQELDVYLDAAALSDLPWVRIIHGKGTGKLRSAVRKMLSNHREIRNWEEGKDGEGDAGVTVARFKNETKVK